MFCAMSDGYKPPRRGNLARGGLCVCAWGNGGGFGQDGRAAACLQHADMRGGRACQGGTHTAHTPTYTPNAAVEEREVKRRENEAVRMETQRWVGAQECWAHWPNAHSPLAGGRGVGWLVPHTGNELRAAQRGVLQAVR